MSFKNCLVNDIIKDASMIQNNFDYQILHQKYTFQTNIKQNAWKIINQKKIDQSTFDGILLTYLVKNKIIDSYSDLNYYANHYPVITNFNRLIKYDLSDRRIQLLHNNSDSPFIPLLILDWIILNNNHHYYYQIKINGIVLSFNVWWNCKLTEYQQKLLIHQTSLAVYILLFLNNISGKTTRKKQINLNYFATPFEKQIIEENNPKLDEYLKLAGNYYQNIGFKYNLKKIQNTISTINVNGGMTNHSENLIVIWRSEEFIKVLIHELVHYFRLEKIKLPNLVEYFNINISNTYPSFPNETITELQTFYLFYVYLTVVNKLSKIKLISMIEHEQKYQISKIRQLLDHNRIKSFDMIWDNSDPKNTINLNCSFIYYYVIKALVLSDINLTVYKLVKPLYDCSNDHYIMELIHHIYKCHNQLSFDTNIRCNSSLKMSIFG